MATLHISSCQAEEGYLYEVMGEDEKLFVFDTIITAIVDGDIYQHNHVFKGVFQDEEGINRPAYNAKNEADDLVYRIYEHGFINTDHWILVGNLSEQEDPLVRLEREWSDNSDHFTN